MQRNSFARRIKIEPFHKIAASNIATFFPVHVPLRGWSSLYSDDFFSAITIEWLRDGAVKCLPQVLDMGIIHGEESGGQIVLNVGVAFSLGYVSRLYI
jgi:hypothetical protein